MYGFYKDNVGSFCSGFQTDFAVVRGFSSQGSIRVAPEYGGFHRSED